VVTAFIEPGLDGTNKEMQMKDKIDDLIFKGILNEGIRDEIYCQVCKQTNGNSNMYLFIFDF